MHPALLRIIAAAASTLFLAGNAVADSVRVVLKGYDPVAYFTEGKPVQGDPRFAYDWDEGRYYFATAKHRDMFAGDPERYAPRFGGHCTASLTRGAKNAGDPHFWAIVDGKLYLVGSGKGAEVAAKAVERLKTDASMIPAAAKNWNQRR